MNNAGPTYLLTMRTNTIGLCLSLLCSYTQHTDSIRTQYFDIDVSLWEYLKTNSHKRLQSIGYVKYD